MYINGILPRVSKCESRKIINLLIKRFIITFVPILFRINYSLQYDLTEEPLLITIVNVNQRNNIKIHYVIWQFHDLFYI